MSERFSFIDTKLSGLMRIDRKPISDDRGFFCRLYCMEEISDIGFVKPIVQINHTLTKQKGSIRGMHFQYPPHTETKVVMCLEGEIFDVAVDVRKGSPTFLQWHSEILSAHNGSGLYIPDGFAHGFQTLTDNCQLLYLHSNFYMPNTEGGLNPLDPLLNIAWPDRVTTISDRDRAHPSTDSNFGGLEIL